MSRVLISIISLLLGLSSFAGNSAAKDYSSLYSDDTLAHWRARYLPGITENLKEVLFPKLDRDERRALANLQIEMPLRAKDGSPLGFYAYPPSATVVLPTMSLKFLDDMSVAFAWLRKNGYSLETAFEYVGLLKYRNEVDFGRWPAPLTALHIPDTALDDPDVNSLANKIFNSAVIFILLHEMGHVLYGHPGYGPGVVRSDARANEAEDDAFALEVMRRLPAQPTGMFLFFQEMVYFGPNRGDFASDVKFQAALDADTHPVTPDRMRAIATILHNRAGDFAAEYSRHQEGIEKAKYLSEEIFKVADLAADTGLQRLIAQKSRLATLASLAPRRPGEMLSSGVPAKNINDYAGTYDGTFSGGGQDFDVRIVLHRNGDRVSGFYSYGAGVGRLDGQVKGDIAYLDWRFGNEYGRVRLTADNGEITGNWGYVNSDNNGGTWRVRPATMP